MSWSHAEEVDATCERCGKTDTFAGDSIGSGHFVFPLPDEVGWGYGEEGELCPDCLEKGDEDANV